MKWFRRKQKGSIVCPTKVLVSAVSADDVLTSAADCDSQVYSRHYADVTNTPLAGDDSLVDVIKSRPFDVVHLLVNVGPDGGIGQTHAEQVLRTCAEMDVKLVFVASDNPTDVYISHFKPGPYNLVMTLERKGEKFPAFLDALLSKMTLGKTLPTAWVELAPQTVGAPEHDALPEVFCDLRRENVVLLR